MIKAVLFDLDGTLLDTLPDIRGCINKMLRKFSYREITREETRRYIGEGARRLFERSLPEGVENAEECFDYYMKVYAECDSSLTHPFEGVTEMLRRYLEKGIKIGIVSNKPQAAVDHCVGQFFSEIPFDVVLGDGGMFPCKPDPSYALYAAMKLRVPVSECAFVGDGETDAQLALNAGMFGVSVLWGYRTREELAAAGARRFASNIGELEKMIENA